MRIPDFGVLIIRILLFRVLYYGLLFSETPVLHSEDKTSSLSDSMSACVDSIIELAHRI